MRRKHTREGVNVSWNGFKGLKSLWPALLLALLAGEC